MDVKDRKVFVEEARKFLAKQIQFTKDLENFGKLMDVFDLAYDEVAWTTDPALIQLDQDFSESTLKISAHYNWSGISRVIIYPQDENNEYPDFGYPENEED